MLTFDQAREKITHELSRLVASSPLPKEAAPLNDSIGRTLANEIRADRLYPPFDRSIRDGFAVRAAEIVLGAPIAIAVASFEDIATVLSERLGGDAEPAPGEGETVLAHLDDDIESLRDLASGAPVVRAVNDLLDKAVELRATDIHIEPFRAALTLRMRVDGLLRVIPTPSDVLPQA